MSRPAEPVPPKHPEAESEKEHRPVLFFCVSKSFMFDYK